MSRIRVLVAEDHAVVRRALCLLLGAEGEMEVVGEAADGEEAVRQYEALGPDVALLDIEMPGRNGIDAARAIRQSDPDAHIVFLTAHDADVNAAAALRAGALGFVPKTAPPDRLLAVVRAAARGDMLLDARRATHVLGTGAPPDGWSRPLTDREREIVTLLDQGLSHKEIAARLFLSVQTIHNEVHLLIQKLKPQGVHNARGIVAWARRQGLL
jgi:DNA-binding NarL/FixJ family response regulator